MFENTNAKTELMIVCDEKVMEYGNYLMQLLGQNDDSEGSVVGTKDGTVSAAIYTAKNYKNTLPKITSNTHILFIGNSDLVKEQSKNNGMHYGWLGKRAVMYVDNEMLKKDDYDDFIAFSKKYQKEFEKATVNFVNALPGQLNGSVPFYPLFTQHLSMD